MSNLSVPASPQMEFLLRNSSLTKAIASVYPYIAEISAQIQRDIVTPENVDTIGHDVLALKRLDDVFLLFKAKGDLLNSQEKKN